MQNVIGLILFFLAGRLFCAANLILPLVSRWEVTKLTSFLQNFLGFCCFECRIWSLVRCSLSTFFGSEGGRPRSSNDEFALEESASLFQSAGRIGKKTQDREIWLQKKWVMISFFTMTTPINTDNSFLSFSKKVMVIVFLYRC